MKRERRQQILWELIDTMFTKVEYWNEDPTYAELTEKEREYLFKTISTCLLYTSDAADEV